MTREGGRRPVTARDFNRLLFALVLLAALAVLARLVTRQESRAQPSAPLVSAAEWLQTADALFLRGEWDQAADAYFGALETAAAGGLEVDLRALPNLAESLYMRGDRRAALHFLRLYRSRLQHRSEQPASAAGRPGDPWSDARSLTAELERVEEKLKRWTVAG